MTRKELSKIIRRYPIISKAIREQKLVVIYYVGHRKIAFEITEEIFIVIYNAEQDIWMRKMIKCITLGFSDIFIIQSMPITVTKNVQII